MPDTDPDLATDESTAIREQVEEARELRRTLEDGILPVATSLEGQIFRFEAPLGLNLMPGGYVRIDLEDGSAIGQIFGIELVSRSGPELSGRLHDEASTEFRATIRVTYAAGTGQVLGPCPPFHDATISPLEPSALAEHLAATRPPRARLPIGRALLAPGVDVELDAGGFGRHTFLCGQSGCGKSYALGVVLERLLLETDLRIVILDPNSDFVGLPDLRSDAPPEDAERWRDVAPRIRVRGADRTGDERLRLRFFELGSRLQAAVAGLDPLGDREEYGALLDLIETDSNGMRLDDVAALLATGGDDMRRLASRVRNLRLRDWGVWSNAREDHGLRADLGSDDWRCLIVDLGSVPTPDERGLVSAAVLAALWERRADRRPVLIVMDEAHNVCPQHPGHPLTAIATEHAIAIAGEGRKYGLHLLVATQRPQKVHEEVLSQCDNLLLMRMNSPGDLARIADLFAFVPPSLTGVAAVLSPGHALAAGRIMSHPMFVGFGRRLTREGGADVPSGWAAPRGAKA